MLFSRKKPRDKATFSLLPLPAEWVGVSGTVFQTFTPESSTEAHHVLIILDDPEFSRQLARLQPFDLSATTGAVSTSAGAICYIVWSISSRGQHVVDYEHTINPFSEESLALVTNVANQEYLDVLIIDSESDTQVGHVELLNSFDLHGLAKGMTMVRQTMPPADFQRTRSALSREFSLATLKSGA